MSDHPTSGDKRISNKLRRLLEQKPAHEDMPAQLFWLVDVIFACGENGMSNEAEQLRTALDHLSNYLETHAEQALKSALTALGQFEHLLSTRRI